MFGNVTLPLGFETRRQIKGMQMGMFKNRQRLFQQPWDIWGAKRKFPGAWGAQVCTPQTPHGFWLNKGR